MPSDISIKRDIFSKIMLIIDERIKSANQAILSAKESRDNETKSSVGDKYETGRAMMQMELEKNRVQLNKALKMKNELEKIDLQKEYNRVEFGSLVTTADTRYFISIGIGKLEIENEIVYCISLASPIGKLLNNKKTGERFNFQGKDMTIADIV